MCGCSVCVGVVGVWVEWVCGWSGCDGSPGLLHVEWVLCCMEKQVQEQHILACCAQTFSG